MGRFVAGADRSQPSLFPACVEDWIDADALWGACRKLGCGPHKGSAAPLSPFVRDGKSKAVGE